MTRALNRSYDEVPITTASAYKMLLTFLGVSSQIFVTDGYAFHNRLMVEKVLSTYNRHRLFISPKLNVLLDDNGEDMFAPITNAFKAFAPSTQSSDTTAAMVSKNDYDVHIHDAKTILKKAVEARTKDPSEVFTALVELEKLMRVKRKAEANYVVAEDVLNNLDGCWRLVFTTGTQDTQAKLGGGKVNYFPLKAVQTFDTSTNKISNGIYIGDIAVVKFFGDFDFDLTKCKLEFDFNQIAIFGFKINLGIGKASELGAASGLGSKNNRQLIEKKKKPFFNWISADKEIATARGGGGGLALWKRIAVSDDE